VLKLRYNLNKLYMFWSGNAQL